MKEIRALVRNSLMKVLGLGLLLLCFVHSSFAQQQGELNGDIKSADQATPQNLKLAQVENPVSDAEERELGASEDPAEIANKEREKRREIEEKGFFTREPGFELYGSLRLRNPEQEGIEDGGSRAGLGLEIPVFEKSYVFARYEAGFDVVSSVDNSDDLNFKETVFKRLAYVGLDVPTTDVIIGKNWSTYYDVGAFTDRFTNTGGDGSGVFNADTDGGATGTGRADAVFQTKISVGFLPNKIFKPFELNVQVQHGNPIPFGEGADYGTSFGLSSVMETERNFALGVAYNHADIDLNTNPSLRDIGITDSAQALLIGARAFGERWYAGAVLGDFKNHEVTDQGIYFEGWGGEIYGQYQLSNRWWLVGGYNTLEPDSDQSQAGAYRVKYAVAGVRFTFNKFRRMIFANIRFNDDIDSDGSSNSDVFTVGVRWDLSKTIRHQPKIH